MDKEKLIAAMREAIMNSIWIDHVGDIAGVESAAGICAEAALKELGNEWVRAEDRPLTESGWIEVITADKVYKGYYDNEFKNTVWRRPGSASLIGLVDSIIVYRKTSPPKDK